ncbi:hypothetical protein MUN77_01750 [Leucobacter allii]|uniref:hypothetical protein n=1 Tax=Leucobacter allii TaxID=2932247 RepID=UPI001FD1D7B8|nr:hypothetical protein [Leucobacter allii]UOR02084.1 hypothetical protein MUN77_01750 [Leucobacter allii]
MSDATKTALDEALAAHVADECEGAIVTGYVLQVQYTDMDLINDQMTGYLRIVGENQNFTTTLGLAHYMSGQLNASMLPRGDDDA